MVEVAKFLGLAHPVAFIRALHHRGLLIPGLALLATAGVLVEGLLYREPPAPPAALELEPPPPSTFPTLTFRPDLEKAPLTYQSDYWLQLGDRARQHIVLIGEQRTPAIVIAPRLALTSIRAADDVASQARRRRAALEQAALAGAVRESTAAGADASVQPSDGNLATSPELVAIDSQWGVALFELPAGQTPEAFSLVDSTSLHAGSFVAAVTLNPDGQLRIMPGHLVSPMVSAGPTRAEEAFDVSVAFPPSTTVAAIVNLDGGLLGVAVESSQGMRLLSVRSAVDVVARLHEDQPCQSLEVSDLDDAVRELLGVSGGVVVERVRETAFVLEPPIRPGDILLEWAEADVAGAEQFLDLYRAQPPGTRVRYRVLRGRRRVAGELVMPGADCRPSDAPLVHFSNVGLTVEWTNELDGADTADRGWRIVFTRPDSPADRGGLQPGDLIVAVNGRRLSGEAPRDAFDLFERKPTPLVLTVRRAGRVKLVAVTPAAEQR